MLKTEQFISAEDKFMFYIKKINDELEKRMNNDLRKTAITASQLDFLLILWQVGKGKMTSKQMQKEIHASQPTVSGLIKRLTEKKLIRQEVDLADHRNKFIIMTPKGKKALTGMRNIREKTRTDVLAPLSKQERKELASSLQKVFAHLVRN